MLHCVFLTICFSGFQTMSHFSTDCYGLHPCRDMILFLLFLGLLSYASQNFFSRFEPHALFRIFSLVLCLRFLMLCVFFCLHVWRNGLRSRADLRHETSRDNRTSAIIVTGCVTYIQLNSSLSYVYSRLTNLSFIGVRLLTTQEHSCTPYRPPGQVPPKAFPSAIHHFHVFASPTLSFYFCYSVDKQNFYSSCYRCCLFSM